MNESPTSRHERTVSKPERLLQSWKQGPVILASGSSFKLESLRGLGMPQATSMPVPEEIEDNVFDLYKDRPMHMHEMVAGIVAREKVKYVVENGAPDNALVCAFDTVVMETRGSHGEAKKRRYLQKPETREQAAAGLVEYFTHLIEGKIWKDGALKDLIEHAERMGMPEALASLRSVGYPQALIHITTGMAVRAPHAGDEIDMIFSIMRLTPNALFDLAPLAVDERQERIAEIVEQALSVMDENERWRAVTTGIDYSDPRIKDLLGLQEAKVFHDMDDSEEGIMQGMPKQAFDKYLRSLAEEKA